MMVWRMASIAAVFVGGATCAQNRSSFYILEMHAQTGECGYDSNPGFYRTGGVMDVSLTADFLGAPLLFNNLLLRGERNTAGLVHPEPNAIYAQGAFVRIWPPGGSTSLPPMPICGGQSEFFQSAPVTIEPQETRVIVLPIIPSCAALAAAPAAYTIGIRVLGTTMGGLRVETPEYHYPVFVCAGTAPTVPGTASCLMGCCVGTAPDAICLPGEDLVMDLCDPAICP